MAQHDYNIANQSFPSFRTDLNNALSAIQTCNSGTSRPTGAVAGQIWLDTTSATSPTLKIYDGADDISLATINYTSNTVDWLDSSVTITGLSTSATGTVLTLSDSSLTSSVNLILQNQKEIRFSETTANGTNYVGFKAPASLSADKIWVLPSADGTAGQFLKTDGAGNLSFDSLSFATPLAVIGNATAGSEIRLPEDTDNGSNYVAIKAPDNLASNLTLTLPSADGSSGQVLQTNGSGVLSFASVGGGILQLKSANEPAKLTTTSTTYTGITNLSVTLTPASSSNKVLILANVNASGRNGANAGGGFAIYKNGSILANANGNTLGSRTRGFAQSISGYAPSSSQEWVIQQGSVIFLDSPATTSSTTYQVYWRCEDTTGGSVLNASYDTTDNTDRRTHASNITVMEISSTIL